MSGYLINSYIILPAETPVSPLPASPLLWLDASDSSTITENTGFISQWNDKSGNNLHFIQNTSDDQPFVSANQLNGLNTISFENDFFQSNSAASSWKFLNDGTDFTIFAVIRPNTYNGISRILATTNTTASPGFNLNAEDFSNATYATIRSYLSSGTVDSPVFDIRTTNAYAYVGNWYSLSLHVYPNYASGPDRGYILRNNGFKESSGNYFTGGYTNPNNSDPLSTLFLGNNDAIKPTNSRLDIAEILIFNQALTANETTQIHAYLTQKWALPLYNYETIFYDNFESYDLGSTSYPNGYSAISGNGGISIISNPQRGGRALEIQKTIDAGTFTLEMPGSFNLNNFTIDARFNRRLTSTDTNIQPNFGGVGDNQRLMFHPDRWNSNMAINKNNVYEQTVKYGGLANEEHQRIVMQSNGTEGKFVFWNDHAPVWHATTDTTGLNELAKTTFIHTASAGNEIYFDDLTIADSVYPYPVPTRNIITDDFTSYSLGSTPDRLLSNLTYNFSPFSFVSAVNYQIIDSTILNQRALYLKTNNGRRPYFVKNFSAKNLRLTFDTACRSSHDSNFGQDEIFLRYNNGTNYNAIWLRFEWLNRDIRMIEYNNGTNVFDQSTTNNALVDSTHFKVVVEAINSTVTFSLYDSTGSNLLAQINHTTAAADVGPGAVFFAPHSGASNGSAYGWEIANVKLESLDDPEIVPGNGPDYTKYYVNLTIPASAIEEDLVNFPVYVDLSDMPAEFFANVQSDGGDIRITEDDGATRLPIDLVFIDTNALTGELHFLASNLSSQNDNVFRVYYSGYNPLSQPGFAETYGRNSVWVDYDAVWHLHESPSGVAPQIIDSTGNGNAGTTVNMASDDLTSGQLSNALDFDGQNDYVSAGTGLDTFNNLTGTISAWANADSFGLGAIAGKVTFGQNINNASTYAEYALYANNTFAFQVRDANLNSVLIDSGFSTPNVWTHLVATADTTNLDFYTNSTKVTESLSTMPSGINTIGNRFGIGAALNRANVPERLFDGTIDEVRVRNSYLSANWISVEYANQNDTNSFYTLSEQIVAPYIYTITGPDETQYYVELTILSSQISSTLTDFPVFVDLSTMPAAFFDNVQSDGGDIRVTESDGVTRVPVDLVTIDTVNKTGELHFLASSLSSTSDVTYRLYYGSSTPISQPTVTHTYGRNAVWKDYEAVWHLDSTVDSAGNDAGLIESGTVGSFAGKLSGTPGFDTTSANGYYSTSNVGYLNTVSGTVQAWYQRTANSGDNGAIVADRPSPESTQFFQLYTRISPELRVDFIHADTAEKGVNTFGFSGNNVWEMVHGTWNNNSINLYRNASSTTALTTINAKSSNDPVTIGSYYSALSTGYLRGPIDELRLRPSALSSNWINSEYINQNTPANFYNVSAQKNADGQLTEAEFTPTSISGLTLWLDAADTSTITESGGSVSQWDDKSGNGYHVTQGTAADQPTTGTRTINSLNVLDFDGTEYMLGALLTIAQPYTAMVVFKTDNAAGNPTNRQALGETTSASGRGAAIFHSPTFFSIYSGIELASSVAVDTVNPHLVYGFFNGASSLVRVDGQAAGAGNAGTEGYNNTRPAIGANGGGNNKLDGAIAEILIFDSELSSINRDAVEAYLISKWGL